MYESGTSRCDYVVFVGSTDVIFANRKYLVTVDPDLNVITIAVKVPATLAHLHYGSVQTTGRATKDEVLDAFRT